MAQTDMPQRPCQAKNSVGVGSQRSAPRRHAGCGAKNQKGAPLTLEPEEHLTTSDAQTLMGLSAPGQGSMPAIVAWQARFQIVAWLLGA